MIELQVDRRISRKWHITVGTNCFNIVSSKLTLQCWWQCPHLDRSSGHELSYTHFQVVHRFANEQVYQEVWYEKSSSTTITVGHVRKFPYISQPDCQGNARHKVIRSICPLLSLRTRLFIPSRSHLSTLQNIHKQLKCFPSIIPNCGSLLISVYILHV